MGKNDLKYVLNAMKEKFNGSAKSAMAPSDHVPGKRSSRQRSPKGSGAKYKTENVLKWIRRKFEGQRWVDTFESACKVGVNGVVLGHLVTMEEQLRTFLKKRADI